MNEPPIVVTEDDTAPEQSRTFRQGWPLVLLAVVIVLVPAIPGFLAPQAAVHISFACLILGPLVLGIADGIQFRLSWSFICLAGLCYFISFMLYYPDGAWVYIIPVVLLAWLGSAIGARLGKKASAGKVNDVA